MCWTPKLSREIQDDHLHCFFNIIESFIFSRIVPYVITYEYIM